MPPDEQTECQPFWESEKRDKTLVVLYIDDDNYCVSLLLSDLL